MPKNNKKQLSAVKLEALPISASEARKLIGADADANERRRNCSAGIDAQLISKVIKRHALKVHKENYNGK